MRGNLGACHVGNSSISVSITATSPGRTITATSRLPTAAFMARNRISGICFGLETSSQKQEHSLNKFSGCVSWK